MHLKKIVKNAKMHREKLFSELIFQIKIRIKSKIL